MTFNINPSSRHLASASAPVCPLIEVLDQPLSPLYTEVALMGSRMHKCKVALETAKMNRLSEVKDDKVTAVKGRCGMKVKRLSTWKTAEVGQVQHINTSTSTSTSTDLPSTSTSSSMQTWIQKNSEFGNDYTIKKTRLCNKNALRFLHIVFSQLVSRPTQFSSRIKLLSRWNSPEMQWRLVY